MPIPKHTLRKQDIEFLTLLVRGEPGISFAELCERYSNHGGLRPEEGVLDILQVIHKGYLSAPVTLTDAGREFLAKPE